MEWLIWRHPLSRRPPDVARPSHTRIHRESRRPALEHVAWMDRVEEALAMPQSEPAGLVTACLLAEGLSPEETAGRLGMSRATVYRRLERWPKQIGETQPELAARFGGDR